MIHQHHRSVNDEILAGSGERNKSIALAAKFDSALPVARVFLGSISRRVTSTRVTL